MNDLRAIREELGLTQAQLAAELHIERNTWWRWESGATPPQHPYILELALAELKRRLKRRHRRKP